jgi:hypothetical protein
VDVKQFRRAVGKIYGELFPSPEPLVPDAGDEKGRVFNDDRVGVFVVMDDVGAVPGDIYRAVEEVYDFFIGEGLAVVEPVAFFVETDFIYLFAALDQLFDFFRYLRVIVFHGLSLHPYHRIGQLLVFFKGEAVGHARDVIGRGENHAVF